MTNSPRLFQYSIKMIDPQAHNPYDIILIADQGNAVPHLRRHFVIGKKIPQFFRSKAP